MKKHLRILHCPTDCGAHGPLLARTERKLGHDSLSVVFSQSYIGYKPDVLVVPFRGLKYLSIGELRRWRWVAKSLRYDVIHYNFGSSLCPNPVYLGSGLTLPYPGLRVAYSIYAISMMMFDVWLLHKLGKVICVTFQGGDARQARGARDLDEHSPSYYIPVLDFFKRIKIKRWAKYADHIYTINPDLMDYLPARTKFLPYVCTDPKEVYPMTITNKRKCLIHVANHREPKGTDYIYHAVHNIRRRGADFQFILAERLPLSTAQQLYLLGDVLVEQLIIGWYGAQAVEFMSLGKPVVAYINPLDASRVPGELIDDLPIIQATKDNIDDVLWKVVRMSNKTLNYIGQMSRKFVLKWHDPEKIARGLIADYRRKETRNEEIAF